MIESTKLNQTYYSIKNEKFGHAFQAYIFLKTFPHAIIEIPRLNNAINAVKPCTSPRAVGGSTGTSVGNIPANKIPTEKIPKVIQPVADALHCCNKPISRKAAATASV